jgi:hypothetical protein
MKLRNAQKNDDNYNQGEGDMVTRILEEAEYLYKPKV